MHLSCIRIEEIYITRDNYETRGITVTDKGNVLVVLSTGEKSRIVEITTSGQQIRTIQRDPMGRQLKYLFNPQCIAIDNNGLIIISDYYNSVLHVLDKDDMFIQYMITQEQGCDRPIGLDLDNHGRLFERTIFVREYENDPHVMKREAFLVITVTSNVEKKYKNISVSSPS
ncbi:hypothetical protein KUTeg_011451 [Tegillarca granosa]|uniref:Uncharacterized protein n=1 Tax=Tegillarca granosa TaxID=220873 RepID=A0ABQ9F475_TEGGR|nr:hypothetical protein KUTeg_011451 [Tegillarca granosa]